MRTAEVIGSTRGRVALLGALVALTALALPVASATASPSPVASAVTSSTTLAAPVGTVAAAADFSSIFADDEPALDGAGWSLCSAPITWSVDLGALDEVHAQQATADLTWAFDQWADASGLTFTFAGATSLTYDDKAFSLTPADGSAAPTRHVFVAFVDDASTTRMGGQTVGLGSPSQVVPTTREIVTGTAIFRTDHAEAASPSESRSLYLHELGHVLGLAHAHETDNIMFPVVRDNVNLGAGDINGVRALDKPCAAGQAA